MVSGSTSPFTPKNRRASSSNDSNNNHDNRSIDNGEINKNTTNNNTKNKQVVAITAVMKHEYTF